MNKEPALLLSVEATAHLLGICERSVWTMIKQRQLNTVRLGRRVLVPRREVEMVATPLPQERESHEYPQARPSPPLSGAR